MAVIAALPATTRAAFATTAVARAAVSGRAAHRAGQDEFGATVLLLAPCVPDDEENVHERGGDQQVQPVLVRDERLERGVVHAVAGTRHHHPCRVVGETGHAAEVLGGRIRQLQGGDEVRRQGRDADHPQRQLDPIPAQVEADEGRGPGEGAHRTPPTPAICRSLP
ncbi:hypothetical protein ACYAFX_11560 [Rhodococcus aetherivorans]